MESLVTSSTLVCRLRNLQDQEAWSEFVHLYGPMVYRLARRRKLDREAADAVVQSFLVRAVEALPKFVYLRGRGRFRSWVLTVALNEIRQDKRGDGARQRATERYEQVVAQQEHGDDELTCWWEQEERRRILQLALAQLKSDSPSEKFAVFHLVTFQDVPVEQAAQQYGLTKPRIAVIKYRMLERLRKIVKEIEEQWDE